MNNITTDRRKTLPVVKIEHDLDEEHLPKRVLPILGAPYSPEREEALYDEPVSPLDTTIPTAVPTWLKLASEENTQKGNPNARVRHSVGLDVPGAVHTITTPSKVYTFSSTSHFHSNQ